MALWRILFLAEKYGRMTLFLDEIAEQVGLAPATIKNRRSAGDFAWIRSDGRQLSADVSDVVAYVESQQRIAHAALASTPPHTASESHLTDAPSRPSGRRRRSQVPAA